MNAITHSRKWHKGQTAFATPKIIHDPQAAYRAGWQDAMDNDLNVPKAIGRLFAFIRHVNRLLNRGAQTGSCGRGPMTR